jgi:SAM-dependent methyltransferase
MTAPGTARGRTSAERLVDDYEELFEPLTSLFCDALLDFAGGTAATDRVIDVAAGTGALSVPIARTGASLLACDISPAAVHRLSEKLLTFDRAETRILDGEALDLPSGTFDAAFSAFGVMLFPDFRAGLRELTRVTRSGGRVAIASWAQREGSPAARPFRAAYVRAFPERELPPILPGVAALSDSDILRRELQGAGCTEVRLRLAEFPWALPSREWVGENAGRLFRDHPMWTALSDGDRDRLSRALAEEAGSHRFAPPILARAWLAVGHKDR